MANAYNDDPAPYLAAIRRSGLTIYDTIPIGDPALWLPTPVLERALNEGLRGLSLNGLALRTRSKVVKEQICTALGYPVPTFFRKTKPRFPGQLLDIYTQKSNNLQIWNEELSAVRRYGLVRISADGIVTRVRVVTGDTLALLDTTGTLTGKYQAQCLPGAMLQELVTPLDTERLRAVVSSDAQLANTAPTAEPSAGALLPIAVLFERLSGLVGQTFEDAGVDQERLRGAGLHRLVCESLGYRSYQDDGRFPDIRHQLLEVKLQTSPTIDLGLVRPDSTEPLDTPMLAGSQVRHCDVRYAVVLGRVTAGRVELTHVFLTTGESFFSRFRQFGGKVLNKKIQIPLPAGFLDT